MFIPGVWEDELNTQDFLRLHLHTVQRIPPVTKNYRLEVDEHYNFLKDKDKKFHTLPPLRHLPVARSENNMSLETFSTYTETKDLRKIFDMEVLSKRAGTHQSDFLVPDLLLIPLYGTRRVRRYLIHNIETLDKHIQNEEWVARKINHHRNVEALERFEKFADKNKVKVKKQSFQIEDVVTRMWLQLAFMAGEKPENDIFVGNIWAFLDIFLQLEMEEGQIDREKARLIVDELVVKTEHLPGVGRFFVECYPSFPSETMFLFLESVQHHQPKRWRIHEIYQGEAIPEYREWMKEHELDSYVDKCSGTDKIFVRSGRHPYLAAPHEEMMQSPYVMDLEKMVRVSLNGGKDPETTTGITKIHQAINEKTDTLPNRWESFGVYLEYMVLLYTEKMNQFAYYSDHHHEEDFIGGLVSSYPYYTHIFLFKNSYQAADILLGDWKEGLTAEAKQQVLRDMEEKLHSLLQRTLSHKNAQKKMVMVVNPGEEEPFVKSDTLRLEKKRPITNASHWLRTDFQG